MKALDVEHVPGNAETLLDAKQKVISKRQRSYGLFMLTLVFAFSFIDRQLLVIMQEPIKTDLGLTDSQLGLLTGFAFALLYVSASIPLAYLADRYSRRYIISMSLAVWSSMTLVTGLASNYTQLLLARMGVGLGEAGCSPPAHSIISDYYPPRQRASALAIYSTGAAIGTVLAFLIGGVLINYFSWREIFIGVGLPGIVLAIILKLSVKEPKRGQHDQERVIKPSFRETVAALKGCKTFWWLVCGMSLMMFFSYGAGNFMPSYLMRSHDMTLVEVAVALSLIGGVSGIVGTYYGGVFSEKLMRRDVRWYIWLPMLAGICGIPFGLIIYLTDNTVLLFVALFFGNALVCTPLAPVLAVSHMLVSPAMRAMTSSLLYFFMNLIGMGLGPLYTGVISDLLNPTFGEDSLRYALVSVLMITCIAIVFFYFASRQLPRDLQER